MRNVLSCTFDPVSQREIEYIRLFMKEKGIRDVYLSVK